MRFLPQYIVLLASSALLTESPATAGGDPSDRGRDVFCNDVTTSDTSIPLATTHNGRVRQRMLTTPLTWRPGPASLIRRATTSFASLCTGTRVTPRRQSSVAML